MNLDSYSQNNCGQEQESQMFHEQPMQTPDMLWQADHDKVMVILDQGIQVFLDRLPNKQHLFEQGNKLKICCIDGRIHAQEDGCVYLREGGTGVLRTHCVDDIAQRYADIAQNLGVEEIEITRHENCGAEGLSKLEEQAIQLYHDVLQKRLVGMLQGSAVRKISLTTINTQSQEGLNLQQIHNERIVYFTKNVFPFNPDRSGGILPKGFVFHGETSDDASYRIANAQVSLGIAFGSHGFGNRFTPESPFLLVVIGRDQQSLEEATVELEEAKRNFIQGTLTQVNDRYKQDVLERSIVVTGCTVGFIQN